MKGKNFQSQLLVDSDIITQYSRGQCFDIEALKESITVNHVMKLKEQTTGKSKKRTERKREKGLQKA